MSSNNKPYYIYKADTGKCIGPLTIEKPEKPDESKYWQPVKVIDGVEDDLFHGAEYNSDVYHYESNLEIYNQHLSSLPTVEVHPDLKAIWKDNQKVYPDKDFTFGEFWQRSHYPNGDYTGENTLKKWLIPLPQPTTEKQPTHTSIEELISQLEDKNPYMGRQGNFDADRRSTGYKRAIIELRLLLSGKIITTPEAIADVWDASVRNWRYQTDCEYLKKQPDRATYLKDKFGITIKQ